MDGAYRYGECGRPPSQAQHWTLRRTGGLPSVRFSSIISFPLFKVIHPVHTTCSIAATKRPAQLTDFCRHLYIQTELCRPMCCSNPALPVEMPGQGGSCTGTERRAVHGGGHGVRDYGEFPPSQGDIARHTFANSGETLLFGKIWISPRNSLTESSSNITCRSKNPNRSFAFSFFRYPDEQSPCIFSGGPLLPGIGIFQ